MQSPITAGTIRISAYQPNPSLLAVLAGVEVHPASESLGVLGFRGMEALLESGRLGAAVLVDLRVAELDADLGLFGFELFDLTGQRFQFLAFLIVELRTGLGRGGRFRGGGFGGLPALFVDVPYSIL